MLFIPSSLISLLTFPGVAVHELAHRLFCDLLKVPVYKICYFRFGNPSGYVIHAPITGLKQSFFISAGPLFINTILCMLLTFSAIIPIDILEEKNCSVVFKILMWLGISIGMHAFPSNQDMNIFINEAKKLKTKGLSLIFIVFLVTLFKMANSLRFFWFDAFYAFGISFILPWLVGIL